MKDGEYKFYDDLKKLKNIRCYPILVVTDETLKSIGFNQLFNFYFREKLMEIDELNSVKIKDLTIIHIDDFLFHTENLKKLDSHIEAYHNYISQVDSIDSMISFSYYLDNILFDGISRISRMKRKNFDKFLKDSLLPKE